MPDANDFFYVEKTEDDAVELFLNLTNVTRMHWDGETMNVFFTYGENAFIHGKAADKLRQAVGSRCVNSGSIAR